MDVAEKRRPQDGRLKTKTQDDHEIELRLSTLPTAFGEKMVMRIFDPDILLRTFEQLGLADDDFDRWQGMVKNPSGIVLVTGPTGSGKTTTLYSSLKQLATEDVNVCRWRSSAIEAGSGHYHGGRNPGSRNSRDGNSSSVDGSLGDINAAHKRRSPCNYATT